MGKPAISAEPMAMASRLTRPWCSREAVPGRVGHVADIARAGFGVSELEVHNGTVRLEGLGGGSG